MYICFSGQWLALLDAKFNAGYVLGEKESIADLATFNLIEWLRMGSFPGLYVLDMIK